MKTKIFFLLLFVVSAACAQPPKQSKSTVKGSEISYEKISMGKNQYSYQNLASKFRDKSFEKGRIGIAEEMIFPQTRFLYNAFSTVFSSSETKQLNNEKSMILYLIFDVDGTLRDITFGLWNNTVVAPQKLEMLEKALVNKYKIKVSRLSKPGIKYVISTFKINLQEIADGTFKY